MENTPVPHEDPKAALLQAIRDDLTKQSDLKKELLNEIKPAGRFATFLEISKHPVFLLILGSLFGGLLSSCYQHREWKRQQALLQQRQQIERKIAVRDEIIGALVEAHSAAQGAVRPLFYENSTTYMAKDSDRTKEWDKASLVWQVNRSKVEQKLDLYFRDPKAQAKLKEIIEIQAPQSNRIFVEVSNVLGVVRKNSLILDENDRDPKEYSQDFKDFRDSVRKKILVPVEEVRRKTKELLKILQDEIEEDQKNSAGSFWSDLF